MRFALTDDWRGLDPVDQARRRQAEARYPELFFGPWLRPDGALTYRRRSNIGLVSVAVRHGALTRRQRAALGEFRLQQYILCGWYDAERVKVRRLRADPALEQLSDDDIHVLAGTERGHLLAYFCMQHAIPASARLEEGAQRGGSAPATTRAFSLGDAERPRFPTEIHSFGPEVFTSLPGLRREPIAHVRELARLVRNQALPSPLAVVAAVEAILLMAQLVMRPELAIRFSLGCMDRAARRITSLLGMPAAYAPEATPLLQLPDHPYLSCWADHALAPGEFWPFLIATEDAIAHRAQFERIDAALALPPQRIRRALVALMRQAETAYPQALLAAAEGASLGWIPDPEARVYAIAPGRVHHRATIG